MRRVILLLMLAAFGCGSKTSPTSPSSTATTTPVTTPAGLSVSVSAATAETSSSGTIYKVTFQVAETSGKTGLTLTGFTFSLQNGSGTTLRSASSDPQSIKLGAGITTNPSTTTLPNDTSGTVAAQILTVVTFTDDAGRTGSASATKSVTTITNFSLNGFVRDGGTSKGIGSQTVRVLSGPNSGAVATTDNTGFYAFSKLQSGTFQLQTGGGNYLFFTKDVSLTANASVDFSLSPVPPSVEYRITGSARRCDATYENSTGGTNQQEVTIPFSYSWNGARTGDFLYMSCQISSGGDSGNITVSIFKNGSLFKSAQAIGFPNIATASGSY